MTNNVERRFDEHKKGKGGRYTRSHVPVEILFYEFHGSRSAALKREAQIKGWSRDKKLEFIKKHKKSG